MSSTVIKNNMIYYSTVYNLSPIGKIAIQKKFIKLIKTQRNKQKLTWHSGFFDVETQHQTTREIGI